MKPSYSHYLLTRFNAGLYVNNQIPNPDEWMAERFDLFESFCLPSVASQTNSHFKWLVMLDRKTPEKYVKKLHECRITCKNMIPFVNSEGLSITAGFQKAIQHCRWCTELQITTRFDNDDVLATDALATIQSYISLGNRKTIFINLIEGYVYDKTNDVLYQSRQPSNAFISVIERSKEEKNIFSYGSHPRIKNVFNIIDVEGRYWIQVIHNRNLMNKIQGEKVEDRPHTSLHRFKVAGGNLK